MSDRLTPYPGVSRAKGGLWQARRCTNGVHHDLGTWHTAEEARAAILRAMADNLEERAAHYRVEAEFLTKGDGQ